MVITFILLAMGTLFLLVIAYNVVIQYRQKLEADQRQAVGKYRAIINETEELLLNTSHFPFSKHLILMLNRRILNALEQIKTVDPSIKGLAARVESTQRQIDQAQNMGDPEQSFRVPENDKQAVQILQLVKKLRTVMRTEHAKGLMNAQEFVTEDQRLEQYQLKINIENAIHRAVEAQSMRQWGTARQLLGKCINILSNMPARDGYLDKRLQDMRQMNQDMNDALKKGSETAPKAGDKPKDDLDVLFQPKKKW